MPENANRVALRTVTIIVPVFNSTGWLRDCLSALCALDYPAEKLEIFAVDNGSQDDSAAITSEFPRVKLLVEAIPGPYAARNRAAAIATGEVLVFTDSDCVVASDWLLHLLECLRGPVRVVLGNTLLNEKALFSRWLNAYEKAKIEYVTGLEDSSYYFGYTNNLAVTAETFLELGPFPTVLRGGDSIFVQNVVRLYGAAALRYTSNARVHHLEVGGLVDYCKKMYLYGKSLETNRSLHPHRKPLSLLQRLFVLRSAMTRFSATVPVLFLLGVTLVLPALAYQAGRIAGRLHTR